MALKDQILKSRGNRKRVAVEMPEWNSTVHVTEISCRDWQALAKDPERDSLARIVVATACDADGAKHFADADIPFLNDEPVPLLKRLADASIRLNGMSPEAQDAIEKNSETPR